MTFVDVSLRDDAHVSIINCENSLNYFGWYAVVLYSYRGAILLETREILTAEDDNRSTTLTRLPAVIA